MPIVHGVIITPDAAAARDLCPECGAPVAELGGATHITQHWPRSFPSDSAYDEGRRRHKLLTDLIARKGAPPAAPAKGE